LAAAYEEQKELTWILPRRERGDVAASRIQESAGTDYIWRGCSRVVEHDVE
jgi:hypothetical protein